jgi:voltage-gated potassium channel
VNTSALETQVRFLYEAEHPIAHRFRYGLLAFDVFTILFIVGTSFLERSPLIAVLDIALGLVILADFVARLMISQERLQCFPALYLGRHRRHSFFLGRSVFG